MSGFPGESIGLVGFVNTSGTPVTSLEDIAYRAGSCTFTAGDAATLTANLGESNLLTIDDTDVTIQWAIEVLSGAGVLNGQTIAGAGTYLLPSSVTVADVVAGGDADLDLSCTSGAVVVQQVKLRVWPAGGEVGGWSAPYQHDDVKIAGTDWLGAAYSTTSGAFTGDDGEQVNFDAQAAMRADVAAAALGDVAIASSTTPLVITFSQVSVEFFDTPFPGDTSASADHAGLLTLSAAYLVHPDPVEVDPPGDFGTDWVYPPDEVVNDPDKWQVTGPDAWGWWQGRATLRLAPFIEDDAVSGNINLAVDLVADVDDPGLAWTSLAAGPTVSVNAPQGTPWLDFDLPDEAAASGYVRFVGWHDGALTEQAIAYTIPFGGDPSGVNYFTGNSSASLAGGLLDGPDDSTLDRIAYAYTPAPFRYWVPSAVTLQPLRLMQRGDGLGMGSGRVFGAGTRQASTRVFGAL